MKTIILTISVGLILVFSLFFILNVYIYSEKQAPNDSTLVEQEITLEGIVKNIDLTPMAYDGPALVTVETKDGEVFNVAVTSMARSLCAAVNTVAAPESVSIGEQIRVRGLMSEEGLVVPCLEKDHYFKLIGVVEDKVNDISFTYPKGESGYQLESVNFNLSEDKDFVSGYILTLNSDRRMVEGDVSPTEGPPTIQIKIYNNPQNLTVPEWIEARPRESNIELALSTFKTVAVGGVSAITYKADGLYVSDVYVVNNHSKIYLFNGAYLDEISPLKSDFEELLRSVTFLDKNATAVMDDKLKADIFTGTLEEVNLGCFVDGECYVVVQGKHITARLGWNNQTVGLVQGVDGFGDLENHIGEKVEVYAQQLSDAKYTLYGSESFYVKLLSGGSGTTRLSQVLTILGLKITPQVVEEDSRCPIDVTCIQAGTVKVLTTVQSGSLANDQVFVLGEPVTTETKIITLVNVAPTPHSRTSINNGEYTFTFKVTNRK